MLFPGAQGDQGRPDDCAAIRITHIGVGDEHPLSVALAAAQVHVFGLASSFFIHRFQIDFSIDLRG